MKIVTIGKQPQAEAGVSLRGPDWTQANPRWIGNALEHSQALPTGGWFVIDGSRVIGKKPRRYSIDGEALVAFRTETGSVVVGPDVCPHMGASLAEGHVEGDTVVCPWHGLRLGCEARGSWRPRVTHDDGVLVWVRSEREPASELTERPIIAERPPRPIAAVIRAEADCEPIDVIANRLDPWHGHHFHPYAFARLRVIEMSDDDITVRVAKRVAGPVCVEVDARFHAADARTIVMTIVGGEGVGSVVETHATPIDNGRTAIVEANLASSDRSSFEIARRLSRFLRPIMRRSARRLWVDDCAYAERRYELRKRGVASKSGALKLIK